MTRRSAASLVACCIVLIVAAGLYWYLHRVVHARGPFAQQALVRSAQWSPAVDAAVLAHGTQMEELLVVAGDILFANGRAESVPIGVDFPLLAQQKTRVGLVLRLAAIPDSVPNALDPNSPATALVVDTSRRLVQSAQHSRVEPAELQIYCDGTPEHIGLWPQWLPPVRQAIGPQLPLSVSVPCDWLDDPNLPALARAAGSLVIRLPVGCDSATIQAGVEQAARIGIPYRIQIPIFFRNEEPTVRPDPSAITQSLDELARRHPALFQGVIWDQLPIGDDALNWRWVCLESVMHGIVPQPIMHIELRYPEKNVTEIDLVNTGTADATFAADVVVSWPDADLSDAQALTGFTCETTGRRSLVFHRRPLLLAQRLAPADRRAIGWLRLSDQAPIQTQLAASPGP